MTIRLASILCLAVFFAGCGDDAKKAEVPEFGRAEPAVEAARGELDGRLREVVGELERGVSDPVRRSELEAEEKSLSEQIRKANQEQLRRDRDEVRRRISEQRRGGK